MPIQTDRTIAANWLDRYGSPWRHQEVHGKLLQQNPWQHQHT